MMATRTLPRGTPYPKPTKRPKRRKKGLKRQRRPRSDDEIASLSRYRLKNGYCEVCGAAAAHIHHILGGVGRRRHRRFNLIALCLKCHDAAHENMKQFRPAFIEIKTRKGEWDQREADRISHGNRELLQEDG